MATAAQNLAAQIAAKRRKPPPLRSTDASRVIDKRGKPDMGPAVPPTRPHSMPMPPPVVGQVDPKKSWRALMLRAAALRTQKTAVANADPGRLPSGSLYPPGMSVPTPRAAVGGRGSSRSF
jgi:hypothetical protein